MPALKFWGTIDALPSGAGFIGVWKVSARNVNVSASTALRVDNGPIVPGAIVEVDGWPQADGTVEAQEIETRTTIGSLAGQGPLAVEFANAALGHYFLTAFPDEIAVLDVGAFVMAQWQAWTFEAHAFATTPASAGACAAGLVPVRRFYNNPAAGADMNHRYVTSAAVAAEMRGKGWIEEGVVMCAQP